MYVEREIQPKFNDLAKIYPIVAIVGPRQAGKSTFLQKQAGGRDIPALSFDDPDVKELFNADIKRFEREHIQGHACVILDEAHQGQEAGSKLKYLADKGHKLWISSSSETMLDKEVLGHLVGRAGILRLYPFSLPEYLASRKIREATDIVLGRSVWECMVCGGYPQAVEAETPEMRREVLRNLFQTMVLKDAARVFRISDVDALERLARYASFRIGGVWSHDEASGELGMSFQTLHKYMDALERSHLLRRVSPFFTNKIKEIVKAPKLFFIDCGLRNAVADRFPAGVEAEGALFENLVFGELLKADAPRLRYWRTKAGSEVDFVLEEGGKLLPIEVKTSMPLPKISSGMAAFIRQYRPKKACLVFYQGREAEREVDGCKILYRRLPGLIEQVKAFSRLNERG